MTDDNHLMAIRNRMVGGYTENMWDDETGAARWLRRTALLGIAARLFFIGVCAFRTWSLDHPPRGGFGHFGPADLVGHGNDASMLLTVALWASYLAFGLFLLAIVSLFRYKLRGDALAVAIYRNWAVRLAVLLYAAAVAWSVTGGTPSLSAGGPLEVGRQAMIDGDTAIINLQVAVIAVLLVLGLAIWREVRKARAEGLIH